MRINEQTRAALRCPHCMQGHLRDGESTLVCEACATQYPVIDGVPVLLDPSNTLFDIDSIQSNYYGAKKTKQRSAARDLLRRIANSAPSIGRNHKAASNIGRLADIVAATDHATVLLVGGGTHGEGMEAIVSREDVHIVPTDVYMSAQVGVIADGHQLPFDDASFDGVIVQAVLEHVLDPYRVVEEIHRVLRPGGVVYGETPFMQQVHGGAYDFTRFSHLGHRRLFRHFTELDSGPCCGPGMALAWSYMYFLRSLFNTPPAGARRVAVDLFARLTAFWLPYTDRFLLHERNHNSYNAASGFFFLGTRADEPISDTEIVDSFIGTP